jgi:WD40 repeat protein
VDGQLAVTASRDKTARVWNAETGEAVTPPMKHPEEIWKAQFLEGDEDILTTGLSLVGSHYRQWRWELKADPRPVDDLLSMAQLLSCNTIDFTAGALTLSKSSFEKFWRDLRSKYAASFTVTTREIENWHRQEYEKCLIDEDTRSAAFHLDLLRAVDPGIAHTLEEQRRARGAED